MQSVGKLHYKASFWHGNGGRNVMPNPQLEQFSQELFTKAGAVILVCGVGALLLRALLDWLERKASQIGRSRQAARQVREPTVGSVCIRRAG
jgi:putative intracellular protease/amidase